MQSGKLVLRPDRPALLLPPATGRRPDRVATPRRSPRRSIGVALLAALCALVPVAAAHAQAPPSPCHGTLQPRQVAELLFGRNIGDKPGVSEAAWARFVARELAPQFPDGLTITDAHGEWRDPVTGGMVRERSKHVEIVLPGKADDETRLESVARAYRREFRQNAVGVIVRQACVSF